MSPAGGGTRAVRVCTATTGFFVLTRCERLAHSPCARCGRSICERHRMAVPDQTGPVCPECYATLRGVVPDIDDDMWAYGYRRDFYWNAASASGDELLWSEFDSYDQLAFDPDLYGGDEFADDTGDDGSLLDS